MESGNDDNVNARLLQRNEATVIINKNLQKYYLFKMSFTLSRVIFAKSDEYLYKINAKLRLRTV